MTTKLHNITIEPIDTSDHEACKTLWNNRFGKNSAENLGYDELVEASQNPFNPVRIHVAKHTPTNTLVGFCATTIGDKPALEQWIPSEKPSELPDNAAFIIAIAVHEDYTNQHVASTLLEHTHDWTHQWDVNTVYAVSWRRDNTIDSAPLFRKYNYTELDTIDTYYQTGAEPRDTCPDCKDICECSGTVFKKHLSD